ncbi:hypothetical protein [Streptomyces sp. NPDC101776]|uniref:hypothetical protein n=1 Tax=Streptomyces sp. NPDC101776 TaxID=3366146 RepID=UPI0037F13405
MLWTASSARFERATTAVVSPCRRTLRRSRWTWRDSWCDSRWAVASHCSAAVRS